MRYYLLFFCLTSIPLLYGYNLDSTLIVFEHTLKNLAKALQITANSPTPPPPSPREGIMPPPAPLLSKDKPMPTFIDYKSVDYGQTSQGSSAQFRIGYVLAGNDSQGNPLYNLMVYGPQLDQTTTPNDFKVTYDAQNEPILHYPVQNAKNIIYDGNGKITNTGPQSSFTLINYKTQREQHQKEEQEFLKLKDFVLGLNTQFQSLENELAFFFNILNKNMLPPISAPAQVHTKYLNETNKILNTHKTIIIALNHFNAMLNDLQENQTSIINQASDKKTLTTLKFMMEENLKKIIDLNMHNNNSSYCINYNNIKNTRPPLVRMGKVISNVDQFFENFCLQMDILTKSLQTIIDMLDKKLKIIVEPTNPQLEEYAQHFNKSLIAIKEQRNKSTEEMLKKEAIRQQREKMLNAARLQEEKLAEEKRQELIKHNIEYDEDNDDEWKD